MIGWVSYGGTPSVGKIMRIGHLLTHLYAYRFDGKQGCSCTKLWADLFHGVELCCWQLVLYFVQQWVALQRRESKRGRFRQFIALFVQTNVLVVKMYLQETNRALMICFMIIWLDIISDILNGLATSKQSITTLFCSANYRTSKELLDTKPHNPPSNSNKKIFFKLPISTDG